MRQVVFDFTLGGLGLQELPGQNHRSPGNQTPGNVDLSSLLRVSKEILRMEGQLLRFVAVWLW